MAEYVLIVDDQASIRYLIQEVLRQSGYETKSAGNGWECLTIVRSAANKPSLILLDHNMPDMTGMEVLSALRKDKHTRQIPVVMISGQEDLAETARGNGARAVLGKPLDVDALLETLRTVLPGFSEKGNNRQEKCQY